MANNSKTKADNSKKNLMIVLIVLIGVVVCLLVAILVIMLTKGDDSPKEIDKKVVEETFQNAATDNEIKEMVAYLMSQISNYQSNNNGKIPDTEGAWNTLLDKYLKLNVIDPGYEYAFLECRYDGMMVEGCIKPKDLTWKNNKKEIYTIAGAKCADDGSIIENNVQRRYAVYTILSGDKLYCSDN